MHKIERSRLNPKFWYYPHILSYHTREKLNQMSETLLCIKLVDHTFAVRIQCPDDTE